MSNRTGSRRQKASEDGERSLIGPPSGENLQGRDASTPYFVYLLAFFSALGGFLFGYDTGVVSGAMLLLKKEMHLSALWQELLVSSTVGAAALSALSGGFLNGWLGRRICILIASFIFSGGGIILSVAQNKEVLLVGRITVGLGIGKLLILSPVMRFDKITLIRHPQYGPCGSLSCRF
ncbi:PREDICTED: proton myo-inositol cotransporter [Cyprinodon variegatus]|uniref:proton myo-inositol cotransporter n=1 Tax=Cyprinodon variegatus TaxID=28743 RepID=UPI0007425277|nr:PREDICTED: proton myo-inositol cotransporter [Cyprinodon variegatus]